MDKNRIEGKLDKAKGSMKEAVGKAIGNDRLRAEGAADRAKGAMKEAAGKAVDAAREGIDKASESFHHTFRH